LDYWTTVYFDLLPLGIAVNAGTDYHVVLSSTNAASNDTVQIMADDGTANSDNRSSMLSGGTWTNSGSWSANANRNIRVRPVIISTSAALAVPGDAQGVPAAWALEQNYPNPFNPTTVISYRLAAGNSVRLAVFDLLGREVALLVNENKKPGTYRVEFDATRFASGIYFYRLEAGPFVQTRKLCLVK
jgi:Secretion system C-terminal sorting domain